MCKSRIRKRKPLRCRRCKQEVSKQDIHPQKVYVSFGVRGKVCRQCVREIYGPATTANTKVYRFG